MEKMDRAVYLVTGAHGFIGSWIVKRLLDAGIRVIAADKDADPRRLRLIMNEDELSRATFRECDITDGDQVARIVGEDEITHVIHLAGLQVPTCRANPRLGAMVNVIGTINVFEAARNSGGRVRRVAYASSAAVFGAPDGDRPVSESDAGGMSTHYGAFKRCNEDNARVYFLDHGISSCGLRPLTVYGVGRDTGMTSDPTKAMKAAVVGRPFHIRFGGSTDFLYVADCADAFIKAASVDTAGAQVFNLHGETVAVNQVVTEIERLIPESRGMITVAETGIAMPSHLDDAAIIAAIGEIPHTSLAQGVQETIERFRILQSEKRLDISDLDE